MDVMFLVMIFLASCKIVLAFLGSSSSALGLQSLGLSGQAPSSSSLDAGTLSDTTASGNKTITVVACNSNLEFYVFKGKLAVSQTQIFKKYISYNFCSLQFAMFTQVGSDHTKYECWCFECTTCFLKIVGTQV